MPIGAIASYVGDSDPRGLATVLLIAYQSASVRPLDGALMLQSRYGLADTAVIEIAPFAMQHAYGVVAVILPIQQSEFEIPITLDAQPDLQDIPRFYQHHNGNFWVALHDQKVVGTVALLDIGNNQAALRKMFVMAEYRGAEYGVAKRLLETLMSWSQTRGLCDIYLGTTSKFLAAHRFYEKNGFREVGRSELPESFPIMLVDTKFYCRTL